MSFQSRKHLISRIDITRRSKGITFLILGACLLSNLSLLDAQVIVVPNSLAGTEGGVDNGYPFNPSISAGVNQMRYQQVFAATQFASVSGPHIITQMALRPDAVSGHPFSATISNIQINLSTTVNGPDGLSGTFSNNIGPNDAVVYSGSLSLSSADTGPSGGPKNFDIIINLQTPFLYDPSAGNLLLDVRNFSGEKTTQMDAQYIQGDSVSRAFSQNVSYAAGDTDSIGLVVQFSLVPLPEPQASWLVAIGVILLGSLVYLGKTSPPPSRIVGFDNPHPQQRFP